jgi:hypothetical protein
LNLEILPKMYTKGYGNDWGKTLRKTKQNGGHDEKEAMEPGHTGYVPDNEFGVFGVC